MIYQMVAPHVKSVLFLSSTGLAFAQLVPTGPLDSIGRLTLDGALVIAVGVLWKALATMTATKDARIAEKDTHIITMTAEMTKIMTMVIETNQELRRSNDEIGAAMDNLASNIAALPCSLNQSETDRAERQDFLRRKGNNRP